MLRLGLVFWVWVSDHVGSYSRPGLAVNISVGLRPILLFAVPVMANVLLILS